MSNRLSHNITYRAGLACNYHNFHHDLIRECCFSSSYESRETGKPARPIIYMTKAKSLSPMLLTSHGSQIVVTVLLLPSICHIFRPSLPILSLALNDERQSISCRNEKASMASMSSLRGPAWYLFREVEHLATFAASNAIISRLPVRGATTTILWRFIISPLVSFHIHGTIQLARWSALQMEFQNTVSASPSNRI